MISVPTAYAIPAALATVRSAVAGIFPEVFRRFGEDLPEEQEDWWGRRFDAGLTHAPSTVRARSRGLRHDAVRRTERRRIRTARPTYYTAFTPDAEATPSNPFYFWTRSMLDSTAEITSSGPTEARIDTRANYRGPLREAYGIDDPVEQIMYRGRHRVSPWNLRALDAAVERRVDEVLKATIGRLS